MTWIRNNMYVLTSSNGTARAVVYPAGPGRAPKWTLERRVGDGVTTVTTAPKKDLSMALGEKFIEAYEVGDVRA